MNTQYDAIDYAQQLEAAGVPKMQAEVHARALGQVIGNCVASRSDLQSVKSELNCQIEGVKNELEHKIEGVKNELEHKIEGLKNELEHKIDAVETSLRADLRAVEAGLNRRIDLLFEKFRAQNRMNALIVALLVGLYVQAYFR